MKLGFMERAALSAPRLPARFAETGKRLANGRPSSRPLLIDAGQTIGLGVSVRGSTT